MPPISRLHEPDICHPPALQGGGSPPRRSPLQQPAVTCRWNRRLHLAIIITDGFAACTRELFRQHCLCATRQLIQGLQATAPQLVVPGTGWRIERRASSPALLRRRSSCYSCPTGRTPPSPFPKLAVAALAASVPHHNTKPSRSWMLE
jgi:hypothetical protein